MHAAAESCIQEWRKEGNRTMQNVARIQLRYRNPAQHMHMFCASDPVLELRTHMYSLQLTASSAPECWAFIA